MKKIFIIVSFFMSAIECVLVASSNIQIFNGKMESSNGIYSLISDKPITNEVNGQIITSQKLQLEGYSETECGLLSSSIGKNLQVGGYLLPASSTNTDHFLFVVRSIAGEKIPVIYTPNSKATVNLNTTINRNESTVVNQNTSTINQVSTTTQIMQVNNKNSLSVKINNEKPDTPKNMIVGKWVASNVDNGVNTESSGDSNFRLVHNSQTWEFNPDHSFLFSFQSHAPLGYKEGAMISGTYEVKEVDKINGILLHNTQVIDNTERHTLTGGPTDWGVQIVNFSPQTLVIKLGENIYTLERR